MSKIICLFLAFCFAVACADDNAFRDMADTNTAEAKEDAIDFAFIDNNCSYVIQMLAPNELFLTPSERYKYSNAVLACSGFDLVGSVGVLLDKKGSNDPFEIVQQLMGTSDITKEKSEELKKAYDKVLSSCTGYLDDNMKTVCGITAAADTVLDVSDVILNVSGEQSVNATKKGLEEALKGKTSQEIKDAVETSVADGSLDLQQLETNLQTISSAADLIASLAGSSIDFSKDLKKLIDDLKDPSTGVITADSLRAYIETQFKPSSSGGRP